MDDGALQLLLAWEPAHARWAVLRYAYNESGHGLVDAPPYAVAYIAKGTPRNTEAGAIVVVIEVTSAKCGAHGASANDVCARAAPTGGDDLETALDRRGPAVRAGRVHCDDRGLAELG
jgi:hypothetical protein